MAGKAIVIIHGWSDSSATFEKLAARIGEETATPTTQLWLGDYVSLDDDVRVEDIAAALQRAWLGNNLPTGANAMDVVVHSTGGLVIREWMHRFYSSRGERPPVQNLVMLAPANFGSPLAHKGRSVIGRVFKGAGSDRLFETGSEILRALEMASPFTWHLAERDRLAHGAFSKGGVRCTVIVGNSGFSGIRSIANEDGSDGTVYVATANLNCLQVDIEVVPGDTAAAEVSTPGTNMDEICLRGTRSSVGPTAFLVLDGFDHNDITGNERLGSNLLDPVLEALRVKASGFSAWCATCQQRTDAVTRKYARSRSRDRHVFQNTVFRVIDNQGQPVNDYAVEFYGNFEDERDRWASVFNNDIVNKVHPYADNPAYRSFMIDVTLLHRELDNNDSALKFSFSALPDIRDPRNRVGYKSIGVNDIGQLTLDREAILKYFQPNRTLLVNIHLPRYQKNEVFRLEALVAR